jgi:preprotein translocase subunit YajC
VNPFILVMVVLLVVMYVLMIRPQRQRQAQQQRTINAAGVGDDILTTGGIYGTITEADGDDVVVEIAEGLHVHMTRRAIAAVLPPEDEEEEEEDVDGEKADDGEEEGSGTDEASGGRPVADPAAGEHEGAVADGEERVRSGGGAEAAAERPL